MIIVALKGLVAPLHGSKRGMEVSRKEDALASSNFGSKIAVTKVCSWRL